jgi:hypothetical protein
VWGVSTIPVFIFMGVGLFVRWRNWDGSLGESGSGENRVNGGSANPVYRNKYEYDTRQIRTLNVNWIENEDHCKKWFIPVSDPDLNPDPNADLDPHWIRIWWAPGSLSALQMLNVNEGRNCYGFTSSKEIHLKRGRGLWLNEW